MKTFEHLIEECNAGMLITDMQKRPTVEQMVCELYKVGKITVFDFETGISRPSTESDCPLRRE